MNKYTAGKVLSVYEKVNFCTLTSELINIITRDTDKTRPTTTAISRRENHDTDMFVL